MFKPLWKDFVFQPHQEVGIQWMMERESSFSKGGILCDEMGLGKTIQLLGLIKESKRSATLLIAPLATLNQWQQAAEKAGICVWRADKSKETWEQPKNFRGSANSLYIVNYERCISREGLVVQREWNRVIFDEAHRMAKSTSKSYILATKIKSMYRWFLTATPIVNNVSDAVSLLTLLGVKVTSQNLKSDTFKAIIRQNVLCRKMSQLRESIPALPKAAKHETHSLDFGTEEEEEFYRGIQGAIVRRWKARAEEALNMTEKFRMIMRLRQISIHPQVYISARKKEFLAYSRPDWAGSSTKFEKLKELIEKDASKTHRWIVFSHFHQEMTMLADFLLESPVVNDCTIYHGTLSEKEKEAAIEKSKVPIHGFQQEVLLVQLQSGGTGLNLQHCDRIVFMGPWWTAALMDQAIGRAVRIGQTEEVMVHHLILKEEETLNIDKQMLLATERKRGLCDAFLEVAWDGKEVVMKAQEKPSLHDAPFMEVNDNKNYSYEQVRQMAKDYPALEMVVRAYDNRRLS